MDEGAKRPTRLGDELRFLARLHPRETWATHPNLGELARFWLERHAMFRQLDLMIRSGAEEALDARTEVANFRPWLTRHLGAFLFQLDEHHHLRANAVLAADGPDPARFRSDLGRFLDAHSALGRELILHLDDEEDLVIPLIIEKS
jgi:hypothetical protein